MYYIGIDLGGTNIAAGITNENGEILLKKSVPTNAKNGADSIIESMCMLSESLIKEFGIALDDIKSVGIGSPGSVDKKKGVVIRAENIGFENTPVREKMIKHFGREVPIYIDNDANCAAWAEAVAGVAKGIDNAVMITLGTGVGGGIIINGKLYSGFNYCGAELGHITLKADGVPCPCGRKGCWEVYSSATALVRMTKEAAEKNKSSLLWKYYKQKGQWNGKTAFLAADEGDLVAKEVIDEFICYLAEGIANMINVFQPEVFVIGGGISNEGERLLVPLREKVYKLIYTQDESIPKTKIVKAIKGNDAGIIGAALLDE